MDGGHHGQITVTSPLDVDLVVEQVAFTGTKRTLRLHCRWTHTGYGWSGAPIELRTWPSGTLEPSTPIARPTTVGNNECPLHALFWKMSARVGMDHLRRVVPVRSAGHELLW